MANIPEGYELLTGRSRDNARQALKTAQDRGLDASVVQTHPEGYLIPLGEDDKKAASKAAPKQTATKAATKNKED